MTTTLARTHSPRHQTNIGTAERVASTIGGLALLGSGLARGGARGKLMALLGAALAARGVTGFSMLYERLGADPEEATRFSNPFTRAFRVHEALTVNLPVEKVYAFWRDVENHARFMRHVDRVQALDERRSRWTARGPRDTRIEWEAEITHDVPNERIAWTTVGDDLPFRHCGSVTFRAAPANRGTILIVDLEYRPPGGVFAAAVARMFGQDPRTQVRGDLKRFRQLVETGELADNTGPRGDDGSLLETEDTRWGADEFERRRRMDVVEEASRESFPASDPPAWTGGRA